MAYVLAPKETEPAAEAHADRTAANAPEAAPPEAPARKTLFNALIDRAGEGVRSVKRLVRRPLPPKELILFASQLSIMAETGTSLVPSLEALELQTTHPRLRRALESIRWDIKSGQMLSSAMERQRNVFPETLVTMISIGESGGFLEQMLDRITILLNKQAELRSTLRSAFTYPLILAGFCVLVVTFMVAFILPKFVSIFADMEAVLPMPTRVLLGSVDFLSTRWMILLPAVLTAASAVAVFFNTRRGRYILDRLLLGLPVAGTLIRTVAISRLFRSVGELMRAGVPLLEALRVSKPFVGNLLFWELVSRMELSITAGRTLSAPMQDSDLVPPTVHQMVLTGETTGALPTTMLKIADFYDARAALQAKNLTTILEPAMIFLVGGMVGFVVLSLLLPIFRMSSVVH